MNQGESRICENHEFFTLKNKILSPEEIKQDVHQSKERLFSFTGICTLLLYVVYISCYGPLKAPPINGPLWVHVLVDLPIIALLAPPNELRHCYFLYRIWLLTTVCNINDNKPEAEVGTSTKCIALVVPCTRKSIHCSRMRYW